MIKLLSFDGMRKAVEELDEKRKSWELYGAMLTAGVACAVAMPMLGIVPHLGFPAGLHAAVMLGGTVASLSLLSATKFATDAFIDKKYYRERDIILGRVSEGKSEKDFGRMDREKDKYFVIPKEFYRCYDGRLSLGRKENRDKDGNIVSYDYVFRATAHEYERKLSRNLMPMAELRINAKDVWENGKNIYFPRDAMTAKGFLHYIKNDGSEEETCITGDRFGKGGSCTDGNVKEINAFMEELDRFSQNLPSAVNRVLGLATPCKLTVPSEYVKALHIGGIDYTDSSFALPTFAGKGTELEGITGIFPDKATDGIDLYMSPKAYDSNRLKLAAWESRMRSFAEAVKHGTHEFVSQHDRIDFHSVNLEKTNSDPKNVENGFVLPKDWTREFGWQASSPDPKDMGILHLDVDNGAYTAEVPIVSLEVDRKDYMANVGVLSNCCPIGVKVADEEYGLVADGLHAVAEMTKEDFSSLRTDGDVLLRAVLPKECILYTKGDDGKGELIFANLGKDRKSRMRFESMEKVIGQDGKEAYSVMYRPLQAVDVDVAGEKLTQKYFIGKGSDLVSLAELNRDTERSVTPYRIHCIKHGLEPSLSGGRGI